MQEGEQLMRTTHCFCAIPAEEMKPWIIKRYVENRPTVQLLTSTDDPREKEIITIVAMLDLDDETVLELMEGVEETAEHILACRIKAKTMWNDLHSRDGGITLR